MNYANHPAICVGFKDVTKEAIKRLVKKSKLKEPIINLRSEETPRIESSRGLAKKLLNTIKELRNVMHDIGFNQDSMFGVLHKLGEAQFKLLSLHSEIYQSKLCKRI